MILKLFHLWSLNYFIFEFLLLSRGFESLKTEIERISYYIHQMHGMHSFFQD